MNNIPFEYIMSSLYIMTKCNAAHSLYYCQLYLSIVSEERLVYIDGSEVDGGLFRKMLRAGRTVVRYVIK